MADLLDHYRVLQQGTLWSSNGRCKGYAVANKGEAAKIDSYVAALDAGQQVQPPSLVTDTGKGIVGMLSALATQIVPTPDPTPTPTFSGTEFRLGDPVKGFDANSTTSTGWTRQAGTPDHVSFSAEKWYGDRTVIDCLVKPDDPAEYGGLRAQIIHGSKPPGSTVEALTPGEGKWISVPVKTNTGYKPQKTAPQPNWNSVGLCLHESNDYYAYPSPTVKTTTPQAPFGTLVATMEPNSYPYVPLAQPHLAFQVYGGIPSVDWYGKGKRFLGPVFEPGHLYVQDVYVLLSSDPTKGQIEIWIDGVQIVPRTTLATTWKNLAGVDVSLYFNLENYRPTSSEITWDNIVSWCGVRVGDDRQSTSYLSL